MVRLWRVGARPCAARRRRDRESPGARAIPLVDSENELRERHEQREPGRSASGASVPAASPRGARDRRRRPRRIPCVVRSRMGGARRALPRFARRRVRTRPASRLPGQPAARPRNRREHLVASVLSRSAALLSLSRLRRRPIGVRHSRASAPGGTGPRREKPGEQPASAVLSRCRASRSLRFWFSLADSPRARAPRLPDSRSRLRRARRLRSASAARSNPASVVRCRGIAPPGAPRGVGIARAMRERLRGLSLVGRGPRMSRRRRADGGLLRAPRGGAAPQADGVPRRRGRESSGSGAPAGEEPPSPRPRPRRSSFPFNSCGDGAGAAVSS